MKPNGLLMTGAEDKQSKYEGFVLGEKHGYLNRGAERHPAYNIEISTNPDFEYLDIAERGHLSAPL